jgi:trehalose synthase
MQEVDIEPAPLEKLATLLGPGRPERLMTTAARARDLLAGRVVWNVNATAQGGGVAEMLQALLAYGRGAGVDTRWLVLDGDPAFFAITKRVHNALHGSLEDHEPFTAGDHEHYERVLRTNLAHVEEHVQPGHIVLLHDPQTAGLVESLRGWGAHVIWRCHIGRDDTNADTDAGWAFLRPYLEDADAFVFSRRSYVPDWVPAGRTHIIEPSIDPFTTKNQHLHDHEVDQILRGVGLVLDGDGVESLAFTRRDGSPGVMRRHTGLLPHRPPPPEAPLVLQVSRWDRLKDMEGVLRGFAEHLAPQWPDVHLMLAGPDVSGVSDDPEGAEVLAECRAAWERLPAATRRRCHLACIPMDDVDENALIVNALQRHAAVVVQKSLFEGFGLTVTEAMWKRRPVLASAVGGIRDQVTDGREGLLLPDPADLDGFAERLHGLLADPGRRDEMGGNGQERVRQDFLGDRHLIQYVDLFAHLLDEPAG